MHFLTLAMDIYDRATETEERDRAFALAERAKQAAATRLVPTGACLNCDDSVDAGVLFCHPTCTTDYERRQAAQKRCGRTGD